MRTKIQKWGNSLGFRKYVLSELLRKVSRRNLHREVPTREPVGREAW